MSIDLTPELSEKIFQKILKKYFLGKSISQSPKGIILGGQPVSGKSFLVNEIKKEFPEDDFIFISTDDLRLYHPAYQQLQKDPETIQNAANLVNPYASLWTERLIKLCIENHFNVMIDSTLGGNVEAVFKTIDMLRENNFSFHLRVMAVHPLISKLSIFLRYEAQLAEKGFARWTRMEDHDDRFEKLETVLKQIISSKPPDSIKFFKRVFDENITIGLECCGSFSSKSNLKNEYFNQFEVIFQNFENIREGLSNEDCLYLVKTMNKVEDMILNRKGDFTILNEYVEFDFNWVSVYEDCIKSLSPTILSKIPSKK